MIDGFRDGEFEYGVVQSLIEDIVDKFRLRAYIYIESDSFDNALSTTLTAEALTDAEHDDIQLDALTYLVADILNNRTGDERNAAIVDIIDSVYAGIHIDDVDEDDDDDEEYV